MDYRELGLNTMMTKDLGLPKRKSETQTGIEQQDRSISLSKLTVGILTGGIIQTDSKPLRGVKIVGQTGIDFYGTSIRFLDTAGDTGGMLAGITGGGVQLYSTTGTVKLDSNVNQLRFVYGTMRWDVDPTAEAIAAADYYVTVNMNGTDYKLMLKSI